MSFNYGSLNLQQEKNDTKPIDGTSSGFNYGSLNLQQEKNDTKPIDGTSSGFNYGSLNLNNKQQKKQEQKPQKTVTTAVQTNNTKEVSTPEPIQQEENTPTLKIEGGVTKNVRRYEDRFPDRSKNFIGNTWSDAKDTVKGLASALGGVANFAVVRPVMNVALADKGTPLKNRLFTGEGIEDIKNLKNALPNLKEGLKENYGQGGIDIVNFERMKEGKSPIKIDTAGLAQSFYAHPFNLLDFVGAGEVGKIGKLKNLTKGGEVSNFSKNVGNKVVRPRYSENLVYNAGQRIAETKPVQAVVNAIDNSPFRQTTDVVADFLGMSPESRLMGTKGAEVRKTKLLEQKNQVKNITERNKAIAANKEALSGLTDVEAKELVKSIESGNGQAFYPNFDNIEQYKTAYKNHIKPYPKDYTKKTLDEALKDLNITKENPKIVKTPIEDVNVKYENIEHLYTREDKTRPQNINRMLDTLEHPAIINQLADGKKYYFNFYDKGGKTKKQFNVVGVDENGVFLNTSLPINRDTAFLNKLKKGTTIYESRKGRITTPGNNIMTDNLSNINPKVDEVKNLLREKVNENAKYYIEHDLLDPQTVHDLPINNYASIKYNKPIDSLTDAEKLDALKDIEKMPKEQQPFYVPIMFDDKLRAGDFFANSTKRYKPNELKHRSIGMGREENLTGGKRVYDPVELANRLDAHRIKMVNTENMVNEIIDNFAKPYDMAKDKILDGYVPFNPDAFMKFYRKSIDLNDLTLRKLDELQNIDTALKASVQEAVKELPEDIISLMGAVKNNKIYQIPKDVANTLMQGKNAKGIWEAMFDMGTAGFKRKVLGLSPKWFINNRIGNGIMAALKGVNIIDYAKATKISDDLLPEALRVKSMYEAEKTIIGRTGGGNNSFFGNTMRLLGGEFIDTSELKGFKKAGIQAANTLGVPGKVINKVTDAMFAFNQKFENLERKAAYIHSVNTTGKKMMKTTGQNIVKQEELLKATLDNPEILDEVMRQVDNTLGDYINMTAVERRGLRKIIPFYSWYRTITRYTLSLAETNPIRADLVNKLAMAINEEDDRLPEYQQGAIRTNWIGEKNNKNLMLNYEHSIPFSTFGDTADNPTGLINPYLIQTGEAIRGQREFMNRPLTSPYYENVFPDGYASLRPDNAGEYMRDLPLTERLKVLPVGYLRTAIPGLEWAERVGAGSLQNLLQNGELTPKDALFDTSFGGYNYNEGFSKRPKGWSNREQLLRYFFPIQAEGQNERKTVKTKRPIKY